jgi:hypothetical protein
MSFNGPDITGSITIRASEWATEPDLGPRWTPEDASALRRGVGRWRKPKSLRRYLRRQKAAARG